MYAILYAQGSCFQQKSRLQYGYHVRSSRRSFRETCNVATKMDTEKNKIVLKYIQFWDILRLLFCEIIVR